MLDELVVKNGVAAGYEGNAQAFRIVTKLSIRSEDEPGLNLTRATLNAILKYPWVRRTEGKRSKKWGAYDSEEADFLWAREVVDQKERKTLEAEIMDFADDIAYSIFDLEDFYRAGKIPIERLAGGSDQVSPEVETFLEKAFARWKHDGDAADEEKEYRDAFKNLRALFPTKPYSATRSERALLRDMTSVFVGRYMDGVEIAKSPASDEPLLTIAIPIRREIRC